MCLLFIYNVLLGLVNFVLVVIFYLLCIWVLPRDGNIVYHCAVCLVFILIS